MRPLLLCLCIVPAGLIACERGQPAPSPTQGAARSALPAPQDYTIRGRIDLLPSMSDDSYLHIHHEPVPDFVRKDGSLGMGEMSMAFPWLAPGVSLEGLQPGEPVELTLRVDWSKTERFTITKIAELPADTRLNLTEEGGE